MSYFSKYRRRYLYSQIRGILQIKNPNAKDKIGFISDTRNKDWILSAICRKLSQHMTSPTEIYHTLDFKNLPKLKYFYFAHYTYFAEALKYNHFIWKSVKAVFFTHLTTSKKYTLDHIVWVLNQADIVICLNKADAEMLSSHGVEQKKIVIQHLAADPDIFKPHTRGNGKIGFCMACYPRKNPHLVYNIVKKMPDKQFILIGRGWQEFSKFEKLCALKNFKYYDNIEYEKYPSIYNEMDVYVSTSFLEGGPVPLLETMLSNIIPVTSNTGFCPDIIQHGENGYLFDPETDSLEYIITLIRLALKNKSDTRDTVINFTWKNYATELERKLISIA